MKSFLCANNFVIALDLQESCSEEKEVHQTQAVTVLKAATPQVHEGYTTIDTMCLLSLALPVPLFNTVCFYQVSFPQSLHLCTSPLRW